MIMSPLNEFIASLGTDGVHDRLRRGLIGEDARVAGPFGEKPLIYADYVASGRALAQIEDFVRDRVLPYYANSHTQASFCGAYTTRLREAARAEIARMTGADHGISVVFTGSGSTAAINRLVGLLEISERVSSGRRTVVLIGPYEHHSNILPWRESGAEVVEIDEAASGGPDLNCLEATLARIGEADLVVGAFSAASNVTGIITNVDAVTRLLKRNGAIAIWDFGCGGPYMPMDMATGTNASKDAIVFSTHKFPGGPGGSGILVVRDVIATRSRPTLPGGGTVSFVSPWGHVYSDELAAREEGGTPNVIGDIRAGLAMLVKEALGQAWLTERQAQHRARAFAVWSRNPRIELLGNMSADALPIFSFRIRDGRGGYLHHQFFTRLLSDVHGIQARGGCACAGPYGHRLLGMSRSESDATLNSVTHGIETEKPGWVRLNFSALMTDEKAETIIGAVDNLALVAPDYAGTYKVDIGSARFTANACSEKPLAS